MLPCCTLQWEPFSGKREEQRCLIVISHMFFSHIWWQNNPKLPQNIIHTEAAPQLHLIFRYMVKKLSASFHPFCFPAQDFE